MCIRDRIYTEDVPTPPQFIGEEAVDENCYINQGCIGNGNVKNSVLFTNVEVGSGAQVVDSVIMPNAVIGEGAKVTRCIVADLSLIHIYGITAVILFFINLKLEAVTVKVIILVGN